MKFFLAGIKGTGMSHLYTFLTQTGNICEGCDVEEDFFTSALLKGAVIHPLDSHLPADTDVLIHSSAYDNHNLTCMREAQERKIPVLSYPGALAALTGQVPSYGVSGTHGKTTVCAVATHLIASAGFMGSSIYGSFPVGSDRTYAKGLKALVIEACEYRDHFLLYDLCGLVITNIAFDHPDWFPDIEAVRKSFEKRVLSLRQGGFVIFHSSLEKSAGSWSRMRPDLTFIMYGKGRYSVQEGFTGLTLDGVGFDAPDRNGDILSDYAAALLLASCVIVKSEGGIIDESTIHEKLLLLSPSASSFPGSVSRCERVAEEGGITFLCDYAHHPDEIRVAIDNVRKRYENRRIVLLFMPHTASRTSALMKEFTSALSLADAVFVQKVYASARDDESSRDLSHELIRNLEREMFRSLYPRIMHVGEVRSDDEAVSGLSSFLLSGDICITMGAGDNRKLIGAVVSAIRGHKGER